ncbi:MAG: DUF975 family protein [Ruminococcus sp.]|nr:DUF975 family protein [Ruminococcus sp.]
MSAEKIIKAQAREKLRNGGWAKALIGLAVITIMYLIIDSLYSFQYVILESFTFTETTEFLINVVCGSIITLIVFMLSPVILGYIKMLCDENSDYDMSNVLYYFSNFKRYRMAISFIFSFVFRMILPTVLCFSLVIIYLSLKLFIFKEEMNNTFNDVTLVLFIISAILWTLRYSNRYFLSFYLMSEDENKPISYYFNTSKLIMCGHESDVVKLFNSFLGWIALSFTVLPLLYVLPYFAQSMCISAKWISKLSRNE